MRECTEKDPQRLQKNLSVIRKLAGWTAADLGERIGITKQSISNLETGKSKLTKTQCLAIWAVLDLEMEAHPENEALKQAIHILLDADDTAEEDEMKIETVKSYLAGAVSTGMTSAAIAAGLVTLVGALSLVGPVGGAVTLGASIPLLLKATKGVKETKKEEKNE